MRCFDEAAMAFGWSGRNPQPASMRDGDWAVGWGCATATYPSHVAPAVVRVQVSADGKVRVQTAAHDIGTGAYTVIGQAAAPRLGVPLANVAVELGDSSLPAAPPVAGGSNTTASVTNAVAKACDAIVLRLSAARLSLGQEGLPAAFRAFPRVRSRNTPSGSPMASR
jgi:xanthine dehydrogenase YagR molybdenum-binding subunit